MSQKGLKRLRSEGDMSGHAPKGDTRTGEVKGTDVKTHMERNVLTAYLTVPHNNLSL